MLSRLMRISAVFLTLAQLAVWGFYAPAHRLLHHSLVTIQQPHSNGRHSHCCQHYGPLASHPSVPADHSPCPDDERDCSLCALALQSACRPDLVQLTTTLNQIRPIQISVNALTPCSVIRPFDSRGPPSV